MENLLMLEENDVTIEVRSNVLGEQLGMLYADNAGAVFRTVEGLEEVMEIIGTIYSAAGLTVSAEKTESTRMQAGVRKFLTEPLKVVAAD